MSLLQQGVVANARLFAKSFTVSAFIGLSYIAILELARLILQYNTGLQHSIVAFVFYILGIFANYALQKKMVFKANNSPVLPFFAYNIINAFMISALSGVFFSALQARAWLPDFTAGASTAIALLLISPITFFVFKKLFNQ